MIIQTIIYFIDITIKALNTLACGDKPNNFRLTKKNDDYLAQNGRRGK